MRAWACGLLVAGLLAASGCGGAAGRPAGKVTWKGTPITQAELRFAPAGDLDRAVFGAIGPDGMYYLDLGRKSGVPVGPCQVTITRYTLPNGQPLPEGEKGAALRSDPEKVARHTYEFDRDIAAGASALDFELSEGRPVGKQAAPVRIP